MCQPSCSKKPRLSQPVLNSYRIYKTRVLATEHLDDALEPYRFAACSVGESNQPTQLAVANALRGVFDGDATSLVLNTQRPNVQARITSQGMVERVVTP